ncbi:uncharacterized protein PAC_19483 [Phialocephala subalpina]|uniref:Nephrocystin 3-like N-terminal domain-containing protein n=1 Tax=Phialocephala subalpina TaxID=576137 RepID=A0A1L7XX03_9HELO|nr:uncharacterized protein PAC_19483 [Phialocephala subalpina]
MVAAAYAKDLLCRIAPNRVEAEKRISDILSDVQQGVGKLLRVQHNEEHNSILNWLTPTDYADQQHDFITRRQEGTGQWLLDSAEFKEWIESDKQTLFSPGIPGAGKTILTAIVIEELTSRFHDDKSIGIAYLYCNFRRQEEQKIDDLLASLLKQLAENQQSLPGTVKELYDRYKTKRTRPSLDEISRSLQVVATLYSRVFIIVDAFDECQISDGCRQRFLLSLFNLQAKCGVNLFATSRPISSIEKEFEGNSKLEIRASEEDVRKYLEGHMFRLPGFVVRSLELQEEIKTDIIKAVDGMFLLAQLHLESLTGKRSPKAVQTALKNLVTGSAAYDHAYESAMERISGQIKDQEELAKQHALGVEVSESKLDELNFSEIEDIVSLQLNKLYDYAAHNWGYHARQASTSCQDVIEFLQKQAQVEASSQALMAVKRWSGHRKYSQEVPKQMTGLHLAAYFGVDEAVQFLIGSDSPDPEDSYGRTPLSWAAGSGHEAVVKQLLDKGAGPRTRCRQR